ncbi:hypothetical protein L195_g059754 [Trifolium pratense]|uniref:Uncharacterized protein n=1 Tax=Trifolium pratense TaxID=57577 RepID=A0A2K3K012_TRIPR|nr:hypothetical protein L195_g059754 [Trifolium pratense]
MIRPGVGEGGNISGFTRNDPILIADNSVKPFLSMMSTSPSISPSKESTMSSFQCNSKESNVDCEAEKWLSKDIFF